jgi:hypothetical protein
MDQFPHGPTLLRAKSTTLLLRGGESRRGENWRVRYGEELSGDCSKGGFGLEGKSGL